MSKNIYKRITEVPLAGTAPEVPGFVTPLTDLQYRETMDQVLPRNSERTDEYGTDCDEDSGAYNCRR